MTLATGSGTLNPFDITGIREDLSDVVSEILLADTNLLSRIGISGVATSTTHKWLEDALNANTILDAESGGLDAAGTNVDLDVTTGQGLRARVGCLLMSEAEGKTEMLQVSAISTDTLTITRGYGSTSAQIHATASTWRIVSKPMQSGADQSTDLSTARSEKSNYCQIFEEGIAIAGDAQAVTKAGVPDEIGHQSAQRLMEKVRELNNTMIAGRISSSAGSSTVYRTMKGLIEWLSASGGNVNTDSEAISPDILNQMYQDAYDDGGEPSLLAVSQFQMRKISKFDNDKIRVVPGSGIVGRFVTQFMTDLGKPMDIVVDRWIPKDTIMLLDPSRITVVPLANRAFGIEPTAKTGDAIKRQIIGDYTLECRNALEAHAIHQNLLTT